MSLFRKGSVGFIVWKLRGVRLACVHRVRHVMANLWAVHA